MPRSKFAQTDGEAKKLKITIFLWKGSLIQNVTYLLT